MIRVLIVDDHDLIRRGLRQLFAEEPDLEVIADVPGAAEALDVLRRSTCDVVLLDLSMPGRHGLDLLEDLRGEFPRVRTLILTMHAEEQFAIRALKGGAFGYLTKSGPAEQIVQAIRKVAQGGKYLTPKVAELLEFQLHHEQVQARHETLSARELAVFLLIAEGDAVGSIAEKLSLSVNTVSNYRTRALSKMEMDTNADIIRYAILNGLVT